VDSDRAALADSSGPLVSPQEQRHGALQFFGVFQRQLQIACSPVTNIGDVTSKAAHLRYLRRVYVQEGSDPLRFRVDLNGGEVPPLKQQHPTNSVKHQAVKCYVCQSHHRGIFVDLGNPAHR